MMNLQAPHEQRTAFIRYKALKVISMQRPFKTFFLVNFKHVLILLQFCFRTFESACVCCVTAYVRGSQTL
jgi:hypothetical protein